MTCHSFQNPPKGGTWHEQICEIYKQQSADTAMAAG